RERPLLDLDVGRDLTCFGKTESGACRALIRDEAPAVGQRNCGVREEDLARREAASLRLGNAGTRAEKRDLHAELRIGRARYAGHVPPFGAKGRMTAVVTRKDRRD